MMNELAQHTKIDDTKLNDGVLKSVVNDFFQSIHSTQVHRDIPFPFQEAENSPSILI
jgi:hypothetical protein